MEIGDCVRRIKLDSAPEFVLSLRVFFEFLQQNSEPTVRFVRIWVKLRCCSENPFGLFILAVIRQKKPKVKICLRISFIEIDCFAECLSGSFLLSKSIMRGPQQA